KARAPMGAFRLALEGEELQGGWAWQGSGEMEDPTGLRAAGPVRVAYVDLRHTERPIEVRVCTRLDGSPFLVRWLEIKNTGEKATAISSVSSMAGQLWSHRYDEHLSEGVTSPFALAYNHKTVWGQEGDLWFEPLASGTTAFDGALNGKSGWSRPAFWARDLANGQTFVCELAWSGNWQFALECQLDVVRQAGSLSFAIGLPAVQGERHQRGAAGEMLRVLVPGETVRTPAVHIGHFQTNADTIVQALHHHVRHTVMPKPPVGGEVEIEANHRGYLCDRENEPGIIADIDVAAEIGAEMYVIDAGWYGNEPNRWWNNTGDWFTGSWLPNGLEPIVQHAHDKGMRFGLWVEIEAAGANSVLRKEHADWLLTRYGVPVANSRALDLSKAEVEQWVTSQIARIIEQYKLDMYRIDHNHGMGLGGTVEREGFVENTLWRYYEAFYRVFDGLQARYPGVVFQNCAGGGARLDLGTLQRFDNTELSDWMRQPRGIKVFNGLLMALPPEIGLRTFGTEVGEHVLEGDLDSQLRLVCLCRPIFRGIAPSVEELNPLFKERIVHALDLYKGFIRPLMMDDALVFHHTPWLKLLASEPWCVLEYASPARDKAVAALFHFCEGDSDAFQIRFRGLDRSRSYRVTFDNAGEVATLSGVTLMNEGLRIAVPIFTSELLLCEAVD
ncbi:MAG: alpha-galactosidase, partial [Anaerolineae bacterium]